MRIVLYVIAVALLASGNVSNAADFALIFKGGHADLVHERQVLNSMERTFDRTSEDALGVAWEIRKKEKGTALGMEYIRYRHLYTPPDTGEAKARVLMFSAKEYLGKTFLRPFIGLGVGVGHTSVTGGANVDPDLALALQVAGGLELRFQHLGLYAEIKGVHFDGDSHGQYDPSSRGVFAGISMSF